MTLDKKMFSDIYAFQKHPSLIDYRGYLSGIFFISGCNFNCGFCHNCELMRPVSKGITWDRLKSICEQFKENWVDGITLSGGEPTLCPSLDEIIQFFKSFGFKIKLDTNGSVPSVIEDLMPQLDCISMDIKCSLQRYPELTGFEKVDLISRSIELVMNNFTNYEFRTTIIPGFHTDDEMKSVMELIYNANTFVLQPFLPRPDLPNIKFRSIERTPSERLQALANMARLYVEKVVVAGV